MNEKILGRTRSDPSTMVDAYDGHITLADLKAHPRKPNYWLITELGSAKSETIWLLSACFTSVLEEERAMYLVDTARGETKRYKGFESLLNDVKSVQAVAEMHIVFDVFK